MLPGKDSFPSSTEKVLTFTRPQQVLWGYFMFRLLGLKMNFNCHASQLTRFLLIFNGIAPDDYKNSYFYKLAIKAPFIIKDDNKLLEDLKKVQKLFQEQKLPTDDIELVINQLMSI